MSDMSGKVALITGASSGIGRATALAFARKGAGVVLAARREDELAALAEEIEAAGVRPPTFAQTSRWRPMWRRWWTTRSRPMGGWTSR